MASATLDLSLSWYSSHLPTDVWPGWVNLGGWLHSLLARRRSPIRAQTRPSV